MTDFYRQQGKRGLDLLLLLFSLPFWLPLLVVIALVLRLIDGPPVFFRQWRAGRKLRPFLLIKFRTLKTDNPNLLFSHGCSPQFTRLGGFLRRSGLDELPQLLHVLLGEMSLVGPRPLPLSHPALRDPRSRNRAGVRPGLTGLAQTLGRNHLSWPERLRWDACYVRHLSPALDLSLLLATLPALWRDDGRWSPGTGHPARQRSVTMTGR